MTKNPLPPSASAVAPALPRAAGALGGGLAGALAGAPFGPIGLLVGAALGSATGAAAGPALAAQFEPALEADYWRAAHAARADDDPRYSFEVDWWPAYRFGTAQRTRSAEWDDSLEPRLHEDWLHARADSALTWQQARPAVRAAWERADRSLRAYAQAERFGQAHHAQSTDRSGEADYEDYRPAYRFGTWARAAHPARDWDAQLEADLGRDWLRARGGSRLSWPQARAAVRSAWDHAGSPPPDGDGSPL